MPLSVFPVAASGGPHFADDFGYVAPGKTHAHQGIDIFAAKGTAVVAVDAGSVRMTTDPLGGQVFYLTAGDGAVYYGAHLSAYEGASREVSAGETIGYVGDTGNARGASPHLHFEVHPGSGPAVDPFPMLSALAPQFATGGASPAAVPPPLSLQAKALLVAYGQKHPGVTTAPEAIAFVLAWAIGEGSFTAPYAGTNNWGSYHATRGFQESHASDPGYGMVAFLDHAPLPYIARMRVYPSMVAGAAAYLDLVEADVGDLSAVTDATDYATKLYVKNYYTGFHEPRTTPETRAAAAAASALPDGDQANIADGATLLQSHMRAASSALASSTADARDPSAVSVGPFAPLGLRLTPGAHLVDHRGQLVDGEPHTIDRARAILGRAADNPPAGAISIADCFAAPHGDGVWMFAEHRHPVAAPTQAPIAQPPNSSAFGQVLVAGVVVAVGAVAARSVFSAPRRRQHA